MLLQDFTGVPGVVDLAAMRDGIARLGGDPNRVNPLQPVELVIDHSVQVDYFGQADAFQLNAELEFSRNKERYAFLRWGQNAFRNFRVVPPDTGIVHQVNLEYLARVVVLDETPDGRSAYPDTLVGTDSHTTMVNGLGVVGWGVGGIEAEAAMLGQPISMLIPPVLGFRLTGTMLEGATATDLVLTITERLRKHGVVGKFVEFFGTGPRAPDDCRSRDARQHVSGVRRDDRDLPDRRDDARLPAPDRPRRVARRSWSRRTPRRRGCSATPGDPDPVYSETIELDLARSSRAWPGPRRPQDRVSLKQAKSGFQAALVRRCRPRRRRPRRAGCAAPQRPASAVAVADLPAVGQLDHGSVVIAAITSCTNTSNPSVMIGAGLRREEGGRARPVAPAVGEDQPGAGIEGRHRVPAARPGSTPISISSASTWSATAARPASATAGRCPTTSSAEVDAKNLVVASVLSGNRNFEGRIQQQVRANYLASPPLVVAYALAGRMTLDLTTEPLGTGTDGSAGLPARHLADRARDPGDDAAGGQRRRCSASSTRTCSAATTRWQSLDVPTGDRFAWEPDSTYIRNPPFFEGVTLQPAPLAGHHRRARAGAARRQHHDRSHFAGRLDQEGQPGREVSDRRTACSRRTSTRTARAAATTK